MNSFPDNKRIFWILGAACVVALLMLIILANHLTRTSFSGDQLQHFDGVLDNSKQTYDTVQSELYVRASQKLKVGNVGDAEAIYREIVTRYPADPDSHEALGACLSFQHKYEDAEASYRRAIKLNPQSVDALYGLSCVAYEQDRNAAAKEYLEKALALAPKNALCHRLLGCVYEKMSDQRSALLQYERAVELDPAGAGDAAIQDRVKALKRNSADGRR